MKDLVVVLFWVVEIVLEFLLSSYIPFDFPEFYLLLMLLSVSVSVIDESENFNLENFNLD